MGPGSFKTHHHSLNLPLYDQVQLKTSPWYRAITHCSRSITSSLSWVVALRHLSTALANDTPSTQDIRCLVSAYRMPTAIYLGIFHHPPPPDASSIEHACCYMFGL